MNKCIFCGKDPANAYEAGLWQRIGTDTENDNNLNNPICTYCLGVYFPWWDKHGLSGDKIAEKINAILEDLDILYSL